MAHVHSPEHVFEEKKRIGKLSQIREIVFGAQDGLLVPLGVVSSVAGAFNNNHIVIVAGISEALAGAFSMATGAFLASQAELQVHLAEIKKEKNAIRKYPEDEKEEMIMIFEKEGVAREDAEVLVEKMNKSATSFLTTMIQKELGFDPEPPGTPMKDALYVGASYLVNATVPLFPYFFLKGKSALVLSVCATLIALFFIGVLKGRFAALPFLKSGLQVMAIGVCSGLGGYVLGTFLPRLLGI